MSATPEYESDEFLDAHLPGDSPAMRKVRSGIMMINRWNRHAAGRVHCVTITGETGVGKYRISKLIVQHSDWLNQPGDVPDPYVLAAASANLSTVLLTALPDTLAESELFGHVKGAFTGAVSNRKGVFGDDNVANVLLDEIGDASKALQGKLLQVVEDGSYRRLGDDPSSIQKTGARILASTRRDLKELVESGEFRGDLYYRLIPFRIHVPPLRERREEIPIFVERIIQEHVKNLNLEVLGLPEHPELEKPDADFALNHRWPGNLRQLSDVLLLWLMNRGGRRLEELVAEIPEPQDGAGLCDLRAIVERRLRNVIEAKSPPFNKIDDFLKSIRDEITRSMYDLCRRKVITDEDLQAVFVEQDLKNIRSRLSSYRPAT